MHAVANTAATTTYDAYDAMGRQLSVTKSIAGAPQAAYTTTYTYDPADKLLTMTYPDGYQIHHNYFAGSGLLNTVTGPAPDLEVYAELDSYRPAGQIGSIYYGNGTATAYSYDAKSSRLTSIATIDPVLNTLLNKSYTYSAAGDVKTMSDHKGVTYTYNYDSLHRLISETYDGPAESFAEVVIENTYNDAFRPYHAPSSVSFNDTSYAYGYDANANTARMYNFNDPANVREQTITYNADNMPRQIEWVTFSGSSPTYWTVDFEYDGQSRRVKKTKSWGSETFYIGDHFEIENGTEVKYIFAGNQRVAKVTASGTHFFHKDHLGSSNVVTDYANGAVVETSEYMPFGQTREHTGANISNYKFTDQELDPSTGLYNYDARLYDSVVGRFVTADSIIPGMYDPQSLNRYAYARNNPLGYVDPTGHTPNPSDSGLSGLKDNLQGDMQELKDSLADADVNEDNVALEQETNYLSVEDDLLLAGGPQKRTLLQHEGQYSPLNFYGGGGGYRGFRASKRAPNPWGKKGSPRHQAYVEDEVRNMQRSYANNPNIEVRTEVRVVGQDGKVRYIDAQAVNRQTGKIVDQVQVGRTNKSGTPVIRERRAMQDIDRATGVDTRYRSYDR